MLTIPRSSDTAYRKNEFEDSDCVASEDDQVNQDQENYTSEEEEASSSNDELLDTITLPSGDEDIDSFSCNSSAKGESLEYLNHDLASETERCALYPPSLWPPATLKSQEADEKSIYYTRTYGLSKKDRKEIELDEFCFYNGTEASKYPGQYESLYTIALSGDKRSFLVDGTITNGARSMRLTAAEIVNVRFGNLGVQHHSCMNAILIQTRAAYNTESWLMLRNPALGYRTWWNDFFWVANFAKYFSDYALLAGKRNKLVTLGNFEADFMNSLKELHMNDPHFENWRERSHNNDLRRHLSQFGAYIHRYCKDMGINEKLTQHPVWTEIGCCKSTIAINKERTLVTPNVGSTFLNTFSQWGCRGFNLLREVESCPEVRQLREKRMKARKMPDKFAISQRENFIIQEGLKESKAEWTLRRASRMNTTIKCSPSSLMGKLVVVRQPRERFDYAVVTKVTPNQRNARIIWMTLPARTLCKSKDDSPDLPDRQHSSSGAFYPIGNELFFSDDCNCDSINISDIVGVYSITLLEHYKGQPCDFFAVQQYCENEKCFVHISVSQQELHSVFMCKELCKMRHRSDGLTSRRRPSTNRRPCLPSDNQACSADALSNISLFSGCGLFDRALETSGCLRTTFSIDLNADAIRSARANSQGPVDNGQQFVTASVNTELEKILKGQKPYVNYGCLSAGAPCPGWSRANGHRGGEKAQRECSLIASVISWVDLLLPAYIIIENVPSMDSGSPNACSQVMYLLVALGYQVRKCILEANEYGGCTKRQRLFILAAAPNFKLPDSPAPTHGDGLEPEITVKTAISDLPAIPNHQMINIADPYHIPVQRLTARYHSIVRRIPVDPPGQSLCKSWKFLTPSQQRWMRTLGYHKRSERSRVMKRVHPDEFFPTIVTKFRLQCARGGELLHYDQHRVLSLEEAARAQGVPSWFVLIGSKAEKLKQIGNAVPWCLGEAIGREIAKAYRQSRRSDSGGADHGDVNLDGDGDSGGDGDIAFGTKEEHDRA